MSKVCDLEIARTGLREKDARRAGLRFESVTIESTSRAGYYPDAAPMTVKMLAERRTGRLLGVQIVGREGAGKRVDIAAVALTAGMTVEQMTALDLGYAPPFSPVWDPVLVAARKAATKVRATRAGGADPRGAGLRHVRLRRVGATGPDGRTRASGRTHAAPPLRPYAVPLIRSIACRACSAGGRDGSEDTDAGAGDGRRLLRRAASRARAGALGPQPVAHRLVQRHRPLRLCGEPPRLLAEPGDVLPGEAHHQRELGLAVGQRCDRGESLGRSSPVSSRRPRDPPSSRRGRLTRHTHARAAVFSAAADSPARPGHYFLVVIPVHDVNPARRTPWVTYALIAANVLVFLALTPGLAGSVTGDSGLAQTCAICTRSWTTTRRCRRS